MSEQIRLTAKFWPGKNEYQEKQNFRMFAGNIGRQQVLRVVVDGYVNLYEAERIEFKVQNRVPHSPPVYGIIKTSDNVSEIEIISENVFYVYLNPKDTAGIWGIFDHETRIISDQIPPMLFNVQFFNYDGTLLKGEEVYQSFDATAPSDPTRPDGPPPTLYPSPLLYPSSLLYPGTGFGVSVAYSFVGWSIGYTNITYSRDVWAVFKRSGQYEVRFLDDDGYLLNLQVVNAGAGAIAPPDPTKEGQTFVGWSADFSAVNADLTVYARYDYEMAVYCGCLYCGDDIGMFNVESPIGG